MLCEKSHASPMDELLPQYSVTPTTRETLSASLRDARATFTFLNGDYPINKHGATGDELRYPVYWFIVIRPLFTKFHYVRSK